MKQDYAIIGRVPNDDEDSIHIYTVETYAQAWELFVHEMTEELSEEDLKDVCDFNGVDEGVYSNGHITAPAGTMTFHGA